MKNYTVFQVDAFTTDKFKGNPAGVVIDADGLTEDQMQQIARELNNSETAFILKPEDDGHDVRIRFFTPYMEVPSCGHATIASHFVRAVEKKLKPGQYNHKIGIGTLPIDIEIDQNDQYRIIMTQGRPKISPPILGTLRDEIISALNIRMNNVEGFPIQIVSTGHGKVIIGVKTHEVLDSLEPNMTELIRISKEINCTGYFVFTFDTSSDEYLTYARMFAPAIGINEDPVTGNGNGPLGAYLVHNKLVDVDSTNFVFKSKQGIKMRRPGVVEVTVEIEDKQPKVVKVAGNAVIVFKTEISI